MGWGMFEEGGGFFGIESDYLSELSPAAAE